MQIEVPKGRSTRPTSAKIRESVMSMLSLHIEGCCWLDLFSGSGSVGLEAVSRGVRDCRFVEKSPAALSALRRNLRSAEKRLRKRGVNLRAIGIDVRKLKFSAEGNFDVIWADPPYADLDTSCESLNRLATNNLGSDGVLVIESAARDLGRVAALLPDFSIVKQKKYGDTGISILEHDHDAAQT